ncbi:MAG: hypothetical protein RIT04_211 [Candidatus Parcubacteria bacterium]|jgi:hypothetical protein
MEEDRKKYRLDVGNMVLLVMAALASDILGVIPIVESFLTPAFLVGSIVYLNKKGVSVWNIRRLFVELIELVSGMVPFLQALPQLTIGMILVLALVRLEDMSGLKLRNKPSVTAKTGSYLNKNGVRLALGRTVPFYKGGTGRVRGNPQTTSETSEETV